MATVTRCRMLTIVGFLAAACSNKTPGVSDGGSPSTGSDASIQDDGSDSADGVDGDGAGDGDGDADGADGVSDDDGEVNSHSGFLHVSGHDILDGEGQPILLRGFGLGEWLNIEAYSILLPDEDVGTATKPTWSHTHIRERLTELAGEEATNEFYTRWLANVITEADVAQYAGWGVNSIRVSLNWHWFTTGKGEYLEDGFARLDELIGWGAKYGVYMIPVLHAAPGGQGNELMADVSDGNPRLFTEADTYQPWAIELWKTIAARYADNPWVGGYDLLDEPLPPSESNADVRALYVKMTDAIRAVDPNHMIFVEGVEWASDFTGLETPWDDNMAYAWHKYWDDNNMASMEPVLSLREEANRPVWNGETGENSDEWDQGMVQLLEPAGIGWSMWTTKKLENDTNPYNIKKPANFQKLLDAMTGSGKLSQAEARTIMLELADNTATSKCTKNAAFLTALGLCADCPPAPPR
jgi:endoglucanase